MFQLHVPLKITTFQQKFAADVAFVSRSSVPIAARMMKFVMLVMKTNVLVKIARIAESSKAVSALEWFET